ncbi:hypothetical protein BRC60_04585 [Halobacteriales archaeon QH_1_68_42]|nr:MAG: hypothetical protein BRC60_04585 [Halobacteriales archaeon QH_1_68_42]
MPLDVEPPPPPELEPEVDAEEYDDVTVEVSDYRRDELAELLADGAWEQAFERWATDTSMDEPTYEVVRELDLIDRFDLFWDDFANRVGYHAPGIPEDWREREIHPGLDSWERVSTINAGLTELGQTGCDVLKDDYIDWDAEYEPPDDVPDFE